MKLIEKSLHRKLIFLGFALGTFAIGLAEYSSMSVLKETVESLRITPAQGKWPISIYALGVLIGAPLFAVLTARMDRKKVMLGFVLIYFITNCAIVFSTNLPQLVILRFLSGLPHGAFFGVATIVASHIVPPEERGKAVSRVTVGFSLATMVGVPLSEFIVAHSSWRMAYLAVAICALLSFILIAIFCPGTETFPANNPRAELGILTRKEIWLTVNIATIGMGGVFAIYSYFEYIFHDISHMNMTLLPYGLVLFGLGMTVGTLLCGKLSDNNLNKSLILGMVVNIGAMLSFILLSPFGYLVFLGIFLVGVSGGMNLPIIQTRLMVISGDAETLGSALVQSAFNIANALGAYLAGCAITTQFGYYAPGMVGLVLAFGGFTMAVWAVSHSNTLRKKLIFSATTISEIASDGVTVLEKELFLAAQIDSVAEGVPEINNTLNALEEPSGEVLRRDFSAETVEVNLTTTAVTETSVTNNLIAEESGFGEHDSGRVTTGEVFR